MQIDSLNSFPLHAELWTLGDEQLTLNGVCRYPKFEKIVVHKFDGSMPSQECKEHYDDVWKDIFDNIKEEKVKKVRLRCEPVFQPLNFNDTRETQSSLVSKNTIIHHIARKEDIPAKFIKCHDLTINEICLLFSMIRQSSNWEQVNEVMSRHATILSTAGKCRRYFEEHIESSFSLGDIQIGGCGEWAINLHVFVEGSFKLGKRKRVSDKVDEVAKKRCIEKDQKEEGEKELPGGSRGERETAINIEIFPEEEINLDSDQEEFTVGDWDKAPETDTEVEEKPLSKQSSIKASQSKNKSRSQDKLWSRKDEESLLKSVRIILTRHPDAEQLSIPLYKEITALENEGLPKSKQRSCGAYKTRLQNYFEDIIEKLNFRSFGESAIKILINRDEGIIEAEVISDGEPYEVRLDIQGSDYPAVWTKEEERTVREHIRQKGVKKDLPKILNHRHPYYACVEKTKELERRVLYRD